MTTGVPESDSYPDPGGGGWDVRPAVPGWNAGQDYTGPLFDDTGWHIDLSDVDWGDNAGRDRTFRFEDQGYRQGNGAGPATAGYDRAAQASPGWTERPSGRHARHARPEDETRAGPGFRLPSTRPPGMRRRVAGQPPPRTQPRRVVPPEHQPPGRDPEAYEPPGYGPSGYGPPGYGPPDHAPPDHGRPGYGPARQHDPARYPPQAYQAPARRPPVYEEPGYDEPAGIGARPRYEPGAYRPPRPGGPGLTGPRAPQVRPGGPARPGSPPRRPGQRLAADGASIVRSSGVMAVGTLGSRLTGFVRTVAQTYALGVSTIAAAYTLSNTLPNVVYNLALGGILTSVIVPLIVAAGRREAGRGGSYDQRMFTLVTLALLAVTVVATAAAVPIVHVYAGTKISGSPATLHLSIIFAVFFIPQIFFYGLSSLISAILNSRGSFAAPMWTPIVNNIVVVVVLGMYVAVAGLHKSAATISGFEVQLLGFGTTLGIIAQTVALVPALRRVGFRWRMRTDFRRSEVAEIGRMGGWMFAYVAATQVAFLVTIKLAGDANVSGVSDYNYAWLLFQLPYAVVGISVITALLPRMSAHASERRYGLVRQDFSTGVRLASTIVVPCSLVLAVLGPKLGQIFLGHGATRGAEADYIGVVFAVFCLGLLPYMIFQLQLRVFYALHDSKTPALIGLVTMTVNIIANLIALAVLPPREIVAGLGVGFAAGNVTGLLIAWRILARRLHGLDGYRIGRSLVRMHAATLPAALVAILVGLITPNALVVVIIGGGLALAMYLLFARVLRIDELTSVGQMALARLGR